MKAYKVHQDIAHAYTIDKAIYTDLGLFEAIREQFFATSWQFITDRNKVALAGDLYPFDYVEGYLPEPLLLSCDNQAHLHCLSNVCTHRGNILASEKCNNIHGITCKYHGRRFNLDGGFAFMPEFKNVKNFPAASDNLSRLPLRQWGNWLFTSLNPMVDFNKIMEPMTARLDWMPFAAFEHRSEYDKDYLVSANWALYCENYLEGFHIPFVHEGLNATIDYGSYETLLYDHSILQIGYSKNESECFDLPAHHIDYGKKIAAYYYWIFPNMMFNFYPWGLSINIVKPLSPQETKVSFLTYVWQDHLYNHGAGSDLDKVEFEDEEVVQNVQKGVRSRFYTHGRYSTNREQGTHHFHRLISQALNHG